MIEWFPIETAPGDREILLVNDHQWVRYDFLPKRVPAGERRYTDDWSDWDGIQRYPTHWAEVNFPGGLLKERSS